MNPINNLLFNALVRRQGINLPGVGSLNVVSTPAEMKKKGVLIPPSTRIELSGSENPALENIVTLLATQNGLDYDSAMGIYTSWLNDSKVENGISIESVGDIKQNFFTSSADLNSILNPVGNQNVNLSKRVEGGQIALWVIGAILLGGIISTAAIYLLERGSDSAIENSYLEATVATTPSTTNLNSPDSTLSAGTNTAGSLTSEITTNPSITTSSAATSSSASVTITPGTTSYYVVIGCYSNEDNANKFIASAKKVDSSIGYKLLPLRNGKFMVYTSVSTTEADADIKKATCSKTFAEAWVYRHTAK